MEINQLLSHDQRVYIESYFLAIQELKNKIACIINYYFQF